MLACCLAHSNARLADDAEITCYSRCPEDEMIEDEAWRPFESEWEIAPTHPCWNGQNEPYAPDSFREWINGSARKFRSQVTREAAIHAKLKMEAELQQSQPIAAIKAAKQLNAFLNNQSLVLLFTFRGKNLLFVGDAQAGNWEHWLFDLKSPDKMASAPIDSDAQNILTSLDFYKVGHHGSSNATPKVAADTMSRAGERFVSMCSTQANVYGEEHPEDPTIGSEVPRIPLMDKLATRSALVRSDQIEITLNEQRIAAEIAAPLPAAPYGSRLVEGPLWVDCFL